MGHAYQYQKQTQEQLQAMNHAELVACFLELQELYLKQLGIDAEKDIIIKNCTEQLNLGRAKRFGASTEKAKNTISGRSKPAGHEASAKAKDMNGCMSEPGKTGKTDRRKPAPHGRKAGFMYDIISGLPVKMVDETMPEGSLKEEFGNYTWRELRPYIYDIVKYVPAKMYVERHKVHVYAAGGKIVRAGKVDKFIKKSFASESLIAGMLDNKFTLGLPINRQCQHFERQGFALSRQAACRWVNRVAIEYFEPLWMRLKELAFERHHMQADETPAIIRNDGREGRTESRFWVFITSELSIGHRIIIFLADKTRNANVLKEFLDGYSGSLTTDGYSAYQTYEKSAKNVILTGCAVHCRRNFTDVLKAMKGFKNLPEEKKIKIPAYVAVRKLGVIFDEEKKLKDLSPKERQKERQGIIKKKTDEFFSWLKSFKEEDFDHGGLTWKAIRYALNQEVYLRRFLEDGELPMHNCACERSIITLAIGRNGWKAIDTLDGATAAAYCYSISETAKMAGADTYIYFRYLLERLPALNVQHCGDTDLTYLDSCLPWAETYKKYEKAEKEKSLQLLF